MKKPRGIIDRTVLATFGQHQVVTGDVEFDVEDGEYAMGWVELGGNVVSRFGDLDYAYVRARMLADAAAAGLAEPPDMDGNFIRVMNRAGRYTILGATFGGEHRYWVVDGTGALVTSPGGPKEATADMQRLAADKGRA